MHYKVKYSEYLSTEGQRNLYEYIQIQPPETVHLLWILLCEHVAEVLLLSAQCFNKTVKPKYFEGYNNKFVWEAGGNCQCAVQVLNKGEIMLMFYKSMPFLMREKYTKYLRE